MSTAEDQSIILCKIKKKKHTIEKNIRINIKEEKLICIRNSKVEKQIAKIKSYEQRLETNSSITINFVHP